MQRAVILDEIEFFNIEKSPYIEFKSCWMAFTETGQDIPCPNIPPADFKREYLNIVFRSSSHISTVTNKLIDQEQVYRLPLSTKPVEFPGCFTAEQREIDVKKVINLENESLREIIRNCDDKFTSRLLVILSETPKEQRELNVKAAILMATEVVHCCRMADVECISGAEFQSVFVVIDKWKTQLLPRSLTTAISRAQYEVVIIVVDENGTNSEFFQYLSDGLPQIKDYVSLFKEFLHASTDITEMFEPHDTYTRQYEFWTEQLEKHLEENGTGMIMMKPVSVRLQLTVIYPQKFNFPSSIANPGREQNKTARASLCVPQNVPTYISGLQKQLLKIVRKTVVSIRKQLHWRKLPVLFQPNNIPSF